MARTDLCITQFQILRSICHLMFVASGCRFSLDLLLSGLILHHVGKREFWVRAPARSDGGTYPEIIIIIIIVFISQVWCRATFGLFATSYKKNSSQKNHVRPSKRRRSLIKSRRGIFGCIPPTRRLISRENLGEPGKFPQSRFISRESLSGFRSSCPASHMRTILVESRAQHVAATRPR
jgi:hypothetical protein